MKINTFNLGVQVFFPYSVSEIIFLNYGTYESDTGVCCAWLEEVVIIGRTKAFSRA